MSEIERLEPLYFDGALTYPPRTLYRRDSGDTRWYYCPETDRFYASVTSIIDRTVPKGYGLIKWLMQNGDDAEEIKDERAAYGTWLHIQFGRFLIEREYSLDDMANEVVEAATAEGADPARWYDDAKKDILAFAAFVQERKVHPIAIELMLCSDGDDESPIGYAGSIDLVCEMTFGGKRITAIVDMKSGRKGFYEQHEIQLHMYRRMWAENFPGIEIHGLFNWSPKDWVSSPTYSLKNQTKSASAAKIPHLLQIFAIDGADGPGSSLVVKGKITPECDLSTCFAFEDAREKMRIKGNGELPKESALIARQ